MTTDKDKAAWTALKAARLALSNAEANIMDHVGCPIPLHLAQAVQKEIKDALKLADAAYKL